MTGTGADLAAYSLTSCVPRDVTWLADAVGSWPGTVRWALGRSAVRPGHVEGLMWRGVGHQMVLRSHDDVAVALLQLVDVDLQNDVGRVEFLSHPTVRPPVMLKVLRDFAASTYRRFPLRKLSIVWPSDQADLLTMCDLPLDLIGRQVRHLHRGSGRYVDLELYESWR